MTKKWIEEKELAENYYAKALSKVAINIISGKDNPYILKSTQIESNGTKRKKILRILKEHKHVCPRIEYDNYRGSYWIYNFEKRYKEHFHLYEKEPYFPEISVDTRYELDTRSSNIVSGISTAKKDAGYKTLKSLSPEETIYVERHIEEFDIKNKTRSILVFPKKCMDNHIRSTLLCFIHTYCMDNMAEVLKETTNVQINQEDDKIDPFGKEIFNFMSSIDIGVRNYRNHPKACDKQALQYHKKNLETIKKWTENRIDILQQIINAIKNKGHEEFIKELILKIKEKLLLKSCILAATGEYESFEIIEKYKEKLTYDFLFPKGFNL